MVRIISFMKSNRILGIIQGLFFLLFVVSLFFPHYTLHYPEPYSFKRIKLGLDFYYGGEYLYIFLVITAFLIITSIILLFSYEIKKAFVYGLLGNISICLLLSIDYNSTGFMIGFVSITINLGLYISYLAWNGLLIVNIWGIKFIKERDTCGFLSLIYGFISLFTFGALTILAIVFGIIGLRKDEERNMAIIGLILGIISMISSIFLVGLLLIVYFNS